MKNHFIFVDDHSGSMDGAKARAALADSNVQRATIRDSANREKQDTIVSVLNIGIGVGANGETGLGVQREIIASNPHVLKDATSWPTPGGTPLWDAVFDAITLTEEMPDANLPNVAYVVITTTDGADGRSTRYTKQQLAVKIAQAQATGKYTFVFRIPRGARYTLDGLGVPYDNIQEWDTTAEGLAKSATLTAQATSSFFTARSAGATASSSYYTNAANVDTSALVDVSKETSLYVVPIGVGRLEIQDFILRHRSKYLIGAAFYQLVKTEARVGPKKIILVRERATGKVFAGQDARRMLNLPNDPSANARVHPGEHGKYDIFIQSESVNRHLPEGTGVIYWEKMGRPVTAADLAFITPKTPTAAPAVPQLPAVTGRTKPTPTPVPKATGESFGNINIIGGRQVKWFAKRDDARKAGSAKDAFDLQGGTRRGPSGERWFIYV